MGSPEPSRAVEFSGTEMKPLSSVQVQRLPVFYRQRDNLFYTGWAMNLPTAVLRIPYSFAESTIWTIIVYYVSILIWS
jgi:hypothetical protein